MIRAGIRSARRVSALLGVVAVAAVIGPATASAQPVFDGDPVDAGSGRTLPMMPGVPLVLPGPDLRWNTADDSLDAGIEGDVDLVVRVGTVTGASVPPPAAAPGGAGLATAVAGGGSTGQGAETPFSVLVTDGSGSPPYGNVLGGAELDGRPVLLYAFADIDGDGTVGPNDADGTADNLVELQELYAYVGRQVGDFTGGRFVHSLGLQIGAPASIGGLRVVLVAGAYTGDDASITFVDGTPIFTLWPFFPPLDPARTLGNGNTPPPDPTVPTEVKWEIADFLIADPSDPVLGAAFAIPTDGSEPSTDQLIVNSGAASAAMLFDQPAISAYRPVARPRLRPAPGSGGGRTLVLPADLVVIAADGAASSKTLRLLPVDFLGNVADPSDGLTVQLVATGGFRIVSPDSDGDPTVEAVFLGSAAGVDVILDDPGQAAQGRIEILQDGIVLTVAHLSAGSAVDSDGDGVLDDGDGSGVVGDAPCGLPGVGSQCDDNCPFTINTLQADHDLVGTGDCCNGLCIIDPVTAGCDQCASSVCGGAAPLDCDDGNPCTADVCDAVAGGCSNTPIGCPAGQFCDPGSGFCMSGSAETVCVAAGADPTILLSGAMTRSMQFTAGFPPPGDEVDPVLDNLSEPLLFAASGTDALAGGSGDEASYAISLPVTADWHLWGRFYYPGSLPNDANSFLVRFGGSGPIPFGNNRERFKQWHWDGDGSVETGAAAPLALGAVAAGTYELVVEKREVLPVAPRLDLLCFVADSTAAPDDGQALALAGERCGSDADCDDGDACSDDVCGIDFLCSHSPTICDDADVCTVDACDAALGCTHEALVCDDGDACTADVCNAATGCSSTPLSCDDSNPCTDDACTAGACENLPTDCADGDACTVDTCDATGACRHAPADCDDGDPCTADSCIDGVCENVPVPQAGGCQATTTTTSTTLATATTTTSTTQAPVVGCEALPAAGCRLAQPGKSVLLLKNGSGAKDKLKWAFKRGDETFVDAFMDPVAGLSEYSLCVYDSAASEQPLARQDIPAGGDCGGRPCWNLSGGRTLSFKDKTGTAADGITDVKLLAGDAARSQVIVKGVGQALGLPDLGLTLPVTVQLVASQDGQTECWQTTYSQAAKNKTKLFRAKGP